VASESSQRLDPGEKAVEYEAIASVQRYGVLEQDRAAAVVFSRIGRDWTRATLGGGATLDLPEIEVAIPREELYRGVELTAAE